MQDRTDVQTMTERDMLGICLEWLDNVRTQDRERYLDAMPNNVPGIDAMRARLDRLATGSQGVAVRPS